MDAEIYSCGELGISLDHLVCFSSIQEAPLEPGRFINCYCYRQDAPSGA